MTTDTYCIIQQHVHRLDAAIIHVHNFDCGYGKIKQMQEQELARIGGLVVEHPQHLYLWHALVACKNNIDAALELYGGMSRALPTNGGSA